MTEPISTVTWTGDVEKMYFMCEKCKKLICYCYIEPMQRSLQLGIQVICEDCKGECVE